MENLINSLKEQTKEARTLYLEIVRVWAEQQLGKYHIHRVKYLELDKEYLCYIIANGRE